MKKSFSVVIALLLLMISLQPSSLFAADFFCQKIEPLQNEVPVLLQASAPQPASTPSNLDAFMAERILSAPAAPVPQAVAVTESRVSGLQSGETVSGIIEVRPSQDLLSSIKKVAYYLDGNRSGKVYQAPFIWGGSTGNGATGFDTRTVSDGNHTLGLVYTDAVGDHTISIDFTINNSTPPVQQGDPNQAVWGVNRFDTVSGIVRISPNPSQLPTGTQQVTWTLVGQHSVTVTQAPYRWGGPGSNGTSEFDTRTLPDGVYDLVLQAQGTSGSLSSGMTFVVENQTDLSPATTLLVPANRTTGGLQFPEGTVLVDVEQAGPLSILADQKALYIVDTSTPSQPQVLSAIDFDFNQPILDILAVPSGNAVFVLERGAFDPVNGSPEHPVYKSRLWRVDLTNPAIPVRRLVATNILSGRSLQIEGSTLYVVFAGDQDAFYLCPLDGSACGIPTDLYCLRDQVYITSSERFSVLRGGNTIRNTGNNVSGDFADTITPSPISHFTGKDNFLFVSLKNGTTIIYDINQKNPTTGALTVLRTIDPQGNDPIFNVVDGNRFAVLDSTGLIEIFDIINIQNMTRVDSLTVLGSQRLAVRNGTLYVATSNQYRVIGETVAPTAGDSRVLGVQEGQVVSGVIDVRPNLTQLLGIRKVAYYLNGSRSGKVYQSPFIWGGTVGDGLAGFDTRILANGSYAIGMVYTDVTGDHTLIVNFTVNN